jgi:hypothetical protein
VIDLGLPKTLSPGPCHGTNVIEKCHFLCGESVARNVKRWRIGKVWFLMNGWLQGLLGREVIQENKRI